MSNLQTTHSDKLPLPGQSIEYIQLTIALTLSQATVHEDRLGVGVIGCRMSSGAWWYRSRSSRVHGKPEVIVWKEGTKKLNVQIF